MMTVTALAVVALAVPGWSAARESKYSGMVAAVNQSGGTIIVEGMGPWRVKEGVTQLDRRTILVTFSTEFVRLKRATGVAPSGWIGDFVESTLPGWQVKQGDWVTITVKSDGPRPTAIRIEVDDLGGP